MVLRLLVQESLYWTSESKTKGRGVCPWLLHSDLERDHLDDCTLLKLVSQFFPHQWGHGNHLLFHLHQEPPGEKQDGRGTSEIGNFSSKKIQYCLLGLFKFPNWTILKLHWTHCQVSFSLISFLITMPVFIRSSALFFYWLECGLSWCGKEPFSVVWMIKATSLRMAKPHNRGSLVPDTED